MSIRYAFIGACLVVAAVVSALFWCGEQVYKRVVLEHEIGDLNSEVQTAVYSFTERLHELRADVGSLAADPLTMGAFDKQGTAGAKVRLDEALEPKRRDRSWQVNWDTEEFDEAKPSTKLTYYADEIREPFYLEGVIVDRDGNSLVGRTWETPKVTSKLKDRAGPLPAQLVEVLKSSAIAAANTMQYSTVYGEAIADGRSRRVFWAVRPLNASSGERWGALAIKFNLQRLMDEFDRNPRLLHFLTDNQGNCLTHPMVRPRSANEHELSLIDANENFRRHFAPPKGTAAKNSPDTNFGRYGVVRPSTFARYTDDNKPEQLKNIEYFILVGYFDDAAVNEYMVRNERSKANAELYRQERQKRRGDGSLHDAQWLQFRRDMQHAMSQWQAKGEFFRFQADRFPGQYANTGRYVISGPSAEALQEIAAHLKADFGLEFRKPVELKEYAIFFRRLPFDVETPDNFLGLGLAASYEENYADVEHESATIRVIFLAIIIGGSLAAIWYANHLVSPLSRLSRATREVANNQLSANNTLSVKLPEHRRDEIGDLARSFRNMTRQIIERDQMLQEEAARTRNILDTAAEGIITVDSAGIIQVFNSAAGRIFGHSSNKVIGQRFNSLLGGRASPDGSPPVHPDLSWSGLSQQSTTSVGIKELVSSPARVHETVGKRADGKLFPMEVAVSSLTLRDRQFYTLIVRDVTEQKRAAEEIRALNADLDRRVKARTAELVKTMEDLAVARDQAFEASRAKSAFLANMSHELRTPLNAIIGFSEMLREDAESDGLEHQVRDLDRITTAGKHLLALINDILDLSKVEAGKMSFRVEEFDVEAMLEDVVNTIQPLAEKNGNKLELQAGTDLGSMNADLTRVRQILFNLLSNACKFTENGSVKLAVTRLVKDSSPMLQFSVTDTGIGMSEGQLKKLFREFAQADNTTTRRFEGTGLGLVITKRFTEMMGGHVKVRSEPGKGSTFTVTLPVEVALPEQEPPPAADETAPSRAPQDDPQCRVHKGDTILVVDDDPRSCELMERMLTKEGFLVRTTLSGEEGLRLAREIKPAVLLLDVLLPDIEGWAILSALKAAPETADIPVILVTMVDDKSKGYALGATDYITKPVERDRLMAVLRKYRNDKPLYPILVVEDDANQRQMLCRMLEREDWTVIEAEDGLAALEQLSEHRPALILLDLLMPVMDGFEFIEELQKNGSWRTIPVIVVTSVDLDDAERQYLNRFVEGVMQKGSYKREELVAAICERVAEHVHRAPLKEVEGV